MVNNYTVSTKRKITCHLKSLNTKRNQGMQKIWNSRSWLGIGAKSSRDKPVNGLPTLILSS